MADEGESRHLDGAAAVCAVVITYNPNEKLEPLVRSLASQIPHVLIVDNGSPSPSQRRLAELENEGVRVLLNSQNLGVAQALNIGINEARAVGARWLATFDQDSVIPAHYIARLFASYSARKAQRVGLVAPRVVDERTGVAFQGDRYSDHPVRPVKTAITSGSLYRVDAFSRVGGFREDYFIDYVDHEFCLRLRKAGYCILEASEVVLTHSLGNMKGHRLALVTLQTTHHSAERKYYVARNRIRVYLEYFTFDPLWVLRDCIKFASELIKLVLLETERGRKLTFTARGLRDGVRNRMGRL